jgi:hypothetical protein
MMRDRREPKVMAIGSSDDAEAENTRGQTLSIFMLQRREGVSRRINRGRQLG